MIKKLTAMALSLMLALSLALPGRPVIAASGPSVTQSAATASFPTTLAFNVAATGTADITDIRLHYVIQRIAATSVTSEVAVTFTPGKKVDASWTLEMVKVGGLPTGTVIDYWWTVSDAAGGKTTSAKSTLTLTDKRYTWRSVTDGILTLNWYDGNDAFAQNLMSAAKDALKRLSDQTGAVPEKPVKLYIYSGAGDLRGSMINPQEWTGGVNYSRYSIIVIGISPSDLAWGVSAMAHELTHQIISQVTSNPYGGLPTWLDEGLAVLNESPPAADYPGIVARAVESKTLISVRSLASPFSAYGNEAFLSYAESYSIVRYLIDGYGEAKMLELLKTFREGATYDNALKKVYGFDMDGLNAEWQSSLTGAAKPAIAPRGSAALPVPSVFDNLVSGFATGAPLVLVAMAGVANIYRRK